MRTRMTDHWFTLVRLAVLYNSPPYTLYGDWLVAPLETKSQVPARYRSSDFRPVVNMMRSTVDW